MHIESQWEFDGFNSTSKTAQTNVTTQSCNTTCQNALITSCGAGNTLIGPITFIPRTGGFQARQSCATGKTAFNTDADLARSFPPRPSTR